MQAWASQCNHVRSSASGPPGSGGIERHSQPIALHLGRYHPLPFPTYPVRARIGLVPLSGRNSSQAPREVQSASGLTSPNEWSAQGQGELQ